MKLSPYYKVFEEEAVTWEEKLNRINALFDVWIDVQRRWVYLEGIFSGSADIKALLPVETSRFQSISSEFLGLMKKVSKSPMVIDVLNIQGTPIIHFININPIHMPSCGAVKAITNNKLMANLSE